MKAFTLRWWMTKEFEAKKRADEADKKMCYCANQQRKNEMVKAYHEAQRYYHLWQLIRERIVNKYGEQNT